MAAEARPVHAGKTTMVMQSTVKDEENGRPVGQDNGDDTEMGAC